MTLMVLYNSSLVYVMFYDTIIHNLYRGAWSFVLGSVWLIRVLHIGVCKWNSPVVTFFSHMHKNMSLELREIVDSFMFLLTS